MERQNNRETGTERGSRSQTAVSASVVHTALLVTLEGLESLEEGLWGVSASWSESCLPEGGPTEAWL